MKKKSRKICVYCGIALVRKINKTRDHVPPSGHLTEAQIRSSNLITVPACNICNEGFQDDESDLRLYLACRTGEESLYDAIKGDFRSYAESRVKTKTIQYVGKDLVIGFDSPDFLARSSGRFAQAFCWKEGFGISQVEKVMSFIEFAPDGPLSLKELGECWEEKQSREAGFYGYEFTVDGKHWILRFKDFYFAYVALDH